MFFQRNNGTVHSHVITYMKAYNFSGVSIRDQVQVSKTFFCYGYVSNISHPEFMRMQWRKTFYQVRITVKEMFAVGSMHTSFSFANQQLVFGQQMEEVVSADTNVLLLKERLQHHQEFTATTSWLVFTKAQHLLYDALFITDLYELMLLLFVKSLP